MRGPAPLTRQREGHPRLIAPADSNAEACRVVEVIRRTGTRWIPRRTVASSDGTSREYPAVHDIAEQPRPRSIRYLSGQGHGVIADRRRAQVSMRRIARELKQDVYMISRKLARNVDEGRG